MNDDGAHNGGMTTPSLRIDPRWVVLSFALSGCAPQASAAAPRSPAMPDTMQAAADSKLEGRSLNPGEAEANKAHVRRLFDEGFNQGDLAVLDELIAPDYRGAAGPPGPAAFKNIVSTLRTAIPDIHYELEDFVAEQGKVAVRWRWKGTHQGVFRGFAPGTPAVAATGKAIVDEGIGIFELKDGKIVKSSLLTDRLAFLQAIGVVPPNDRLYPPKP